MDFDYFLFFSQTWTPFFYWKNLLLAWKTSRTRVRWHISNPFQCLCCCLSADPILSRSLPALCYMLHLTLSLISLSAGGGSLLLALANFYSQVNKPRRLQLEMENGDWGLGVWKLRAAWKVGVFNLGVTVSSVDCAGDKSVAQIFAANIYLQWEREREKHLVEVLAAWRAGWRGNLKLYYASAV